MRLVLTTLTVTSSQQILRLVETGIENAKCRYITADIEAIEPVLRMLRVTWSQQILRLVETDIDNLNSYFVTTDIEAC